ncbi:hypothetical protein [Halocatena marina]|uniref:hypothetical protein n=1 Tax=Halocatena marina TaxID=2934937 RepID=UPI00200FA57C|nr:hypothetical protein [Halocatena marina]
MGTGLQTTIVSRLSETQLLIIGGLLLVISTILALSIAPISNAVPTVIAGLASLGLAAGALLVGLSKAGAGV